MIFEPLDNPLLASNCLMLFISELHEHFKPRRALSRMRMDLAFGKPTME